jgi:nucleoid DNA-binding protein
VNKRELTDTLTEWVQNDGVDVSRADITKILALFDELVVETVTGGEDVLLSGFIKFSTKDIPAKPRRKGDNPFTGEKGVWFKAKPATRRVKIAPLSAFKVAVSAKRARKAAPVAN